MSNPAGSTATAYTADGTPVPIVVNVVLPAQAATAQSTSAAESSDVLQPTVAHVGQPQAPLNTATPAEASSTTQSLANLTTGIAGMIISAPGALVEKVTPLVQEALHHGQQKAAEVISSAGHHGAQAAQAVSDTSSQVAGSVAQTSSDAVHSAQRTAGATSDAFGQAADSAKSTVHEQAQSVPSTGEVKHAAESYLEQAKELVSSYLPAALGGHSPTTHSASTLSAPAHTSTEVVAKDDIKDVGTAKLIDRYQSDATSSDAGVLGGTATVEPVPRPDAGVHDLGREGPVTPAPTRSTTNTVASTELPHETSNASLVDQAKNALSNSAFTNPSTSASSGYTAGSVTDTGRQSAGDKIGSAVKPDSEKTYTEIAADTVRGKADAAASYLQSDSYKSLGQSITDTVTPSNSSSTRTGNVARQSVGDKLGAGLKPDSQKTYTEIATDTIKGKADAAASYLQPESDKSLGQSVVDAVTPSNRA